MKKVLSLFLVSILLVSTLVGCSSKQPIGNSSDSSITEGGATTENDLIGNQTIEMNIATVWATDDSTPNLGLNYFKDRVESLSDGKIKVTLHKGTLGGERELYEAVQLNSIQATPCTTGPLGGFVPLAEIFMVPYLFKDFDHAYACLDGKLGDRLNEMALETDLRFLGWWAIGDRGIYGNGPRPMTPEDLKGKKIRIMETPFLVALYEHYGAVATPMAYNEVYTALQQGAIDGCQSALASISVGHNEVTDWYADLKENLSIVPFTVSEKWWQSLPQEARDIIIQAQNEAEVIERKLDKESAIILADKWEKSGSIPYEVDRKAFEAKAKELYPKYKELLKDTEGWIDWAVKIGEVFPVKLEEPGYTEVKFDF